MSMVLQAKLICDAGGEGCVGVGTCVDTLYVDAHISYESSPPKVVPNNLPKGWRKVADGVHVCGSDACELALKRKVLG